MRSEIHVFQANTDHLDDNDSNAIDARFHLGLDPQVDKVQELVRKGFVKYAKVAVLKGSTNLDLAYERTNSIHGPWFEENVGTYPSGVSLEKTVPDGARSSMCGDILVVVTDNKLTGYMVASFGFTALPAIDVFGIEL